MAILLLAWDITDGLWADPIIIFLVLRIAFCFARHEAPLQRFRSDTDVRRSNERAVSRVANVPR